MDNSVNTYLHEAENKSFSQVTMAEEERSKSSANKGVTHAASQARREYAVGLKIAGMSISTIVLQINDLADVKQWGKVHRGIVEKDIAQYYRETAPLREGEYDHLEQMRNVHIAQMEATAEKMALLIAKKERGDTWKPFEQADAIEKLHKMQMNLAEIHDWNMGRKNPMVSFVQNDVTAIYDAASIALVRTQDKSLIGDVSSALKQLATHLQETREEERTASDRNVIDVVAEAQMT